MSLEMIDSLLDHILADGLETSPSRGPDPALETQPANLDVVVDLLISQGATGRPGVRSRDRRAGVLARA